MQCLICCESITELTGRCTLFCKHTFHIYCISRWCDRPRQTCPLCRRFLSKDEKFWSRGSREKKSKRDPLINPPEEQQMMWDAMRLFDNSSDYQGPNPNIQIRKNWRSRRNRYKHPLASRGIHTHTDFITYTTEYDSD